MSFAVRVLRKSPGFAATAILTVGICLGANLAIFALTDTILLRPLPFPDSARLVAIFNSYPKVGVGRSGASLPNYYERRGRIAAVASLSIYRFGTALVGEPAAVVREDIMRVSPEFFTTLV